jgi:SpoVK/Ycf46/Vps4 family AAA+-type ATPase
VETIKIHAFPDRDKIDQLFKSFFNPKVVERIEKLGFNHKIGILLHGKEGTGKSTIGKYYCDQALVNHKAIIFNFEGTEPHHIIKCWDFITNIRRIQSNPIVVVFEEIDQLLKREGEGLLKRILDGDSSISNCIFLATTNYIDEIPDAIKYRPSRFKYCLNIEGIQSISDVQLIMMRMLSEHCSEEEVKEFAIELQGNTLDVIKQFCIDKIMNLKTYEKPKKTVGFKTKS